MDRETSSTANGDRQTRLLPVDACKIGQFVFQDPRQNFLGEWTIELSDHGDDAANLREAASQLRYSDMPVAFPTETVYGLGADASRGSAVRGVYLVKQRPADNPLIVHVCSLGQLRRILTNKDAASSPVGALQPCHDPIPSIYHPLITKFWPGPLTLILPLPVPSPFATEVTTSMPSFGARMPSSRLALALIYLAGVPLAAPSANSSTRPSPTTASHVLHDLKGRIDLILDGGPCAVGLESTVVNGMTQPPVILRPGGVPIEKIKECPGWENVRVGYKGALETGIPKAPGMKYKHYSPAARLVLVHGELNITAVRPFLGDDHIVGLVKTETEGKRPTPRSETPDDQLHTEEHAEKITSEARYGTNESNAQHSEVDWDDARGQQRIDVWTVDLGPTSADVARGLFSALRDLDQKTVSTVFVQGIDEDSDGFAAAVMNRLRKAAECEIEIRDTGLVLPAQPGQQKKLID